MNAIEIKNVSKRFKDFELSDISINLPEGCILGLIGENGAGKTTTIKLILDVFNKDKGTIEVLGEDHTKIDKNKLGVVSDNFGLPECLNIQEIEDVMSNIYQNWDKDEFNRIKKLLKIDEEKKYKDMSTGNKMKISLAIALSHNASLLILDEATNGLDPIVRDEVMDLLFEFTRDEKHSVLISSHIVSDLEKICDYICFIHEGKVLLCEEKDTLLETYGVMPVNKDEEFSCDDRAIIRKRSNPYNNEYLVNRKHIKEDVKVNNINLEDLFIFMIRGEK